MKIERIMKTGALALTLVGISGLMLGSAISGRGIGNIESSVNYIPQRLYQIQDELSETSRDDQKYKFLIEEQKTYLDNPQISEAFYHNNRGEAMKYCGFAIMLAPSITLATGLACLMTDTSKKDKMKWGEEE